MDISYTSNGGDCTYIVVRYQDQWELDLHSYSMIPEASGSIRKMRFSTPHKCSYALVLRLILTGYSLVRGGVFEYIRPQTATMSYTRSLLWHLYEGHQVHGYHLIWHSYAYGRCEELLCLSHSEITLARDYSTVIDWTRSFVDLSYIYICPHSHSLRTLGLQTSEI